MKGAKRIISLEHWTQRIRNKMELMSIELAIGLFYLFIWFCYGNRIEMEKETHESFYTMHSMANIQRSALIYVNLWTVLNVLCSACICWVPIDDNKFVWQNALNDISLSHIMMMSGSSGYWMLRIHTYTNSIILYERMKTLWNLWPMCNVQRGFFSSLHSLHEIDFGCVRLSFCSIFFLLFILQNLVRLITFVEYSFTWAINYEFLCLSLLPLYDILGALCATTYIYNYIYGLLVLLWNSVSNNVSCGFLRIWQNDRRAWSTSHCASSFCCFAPYWSPFKNFIRLLFRHLN